jgi:hypothetical protein
VDLFRHIEELSLVADFGGHELNLIRLITVVTMPNGMDVLLNPR